MIFDDTRCSLGEGPLWHPLRKSLIWFDILGKSMFERALSEKQAKIWKFDEFVSAAGWIDNSHLIVASQSGLWKFNLDTTARERICALEADNSRTRSNDGRADPHGGFWIGTMGINAEPHEGAIYRWFRGELRELYGNITISNSICFSPDASTAYFCDTPTQKIMKVALDDEGWPRRPPELFIDVSPHNPDGSVVDAKGNLWNAQWGSNRVACYDTHGNLVEGVTFEASQISCPAFGGENLNKLFATSASIGLKNPVAENAGAVFSSVLSMNGQREHQVILE